MFDPFLMQKILVGVVGLVLLLAISQHVVKGRVDKDMLALLSGGIVLHFVFKGWLLRHGWLHPVAVIKKAGIGRHESPAPEISPPEIEQDRHTELLAAMNPDLRVPMDGIIGTTELLLETSLSAQQKEYAETILQSAESLLVLINDLKVEADETVKNPSGMTALAGHHILVVEDNRVNQLFIQEVLTQMGCRVTVADDGSDALVVAQQERGFSLILMDCYMPRMDGFEATRQLRAEQANGRLPQLPIIALTALTMDGDRERCRAAGMDDFLTKPVVKADLIAMLLKWTGNGAVTTPVTDVWVETAKDCIDSRAQDELRAVLGQKFSAFVDVYVQDTETRLSDIGRLLGGGDNVRPIALHAHSISSSSAYVGAFRVADIASRLETKAGTAECSLAVLTTLFEDMRQSFAVTKDVLIDDENRRKTAI